MLGVQAGLDPLGEVDLFLSGQQLPAADRLQIRVDRVAHDRGLVVQVGLWSGSRLPAIRSHGLWNGLRRFARNEGSQLRVQITGQVSDLADRELGGSGCVSQFRWLVAELNTGLSQLADDGTGLRRGNARRVEGVAK